MRCGGKQLIILPGALPILAGYSGLHSHWLAHHRRALIRFLILHEPITCSYTVIEIGFSWRGKKGFSHTKRRYSTQYEWNIEREPWCKSMLVLYPLPLLHGLKLFPTLRHNQFPRLPNQKRTKPLQHCVVSNRTRNSVNRYTPNIYIYIYIYIYVTYNLH